MCHVIESAVEIFPAAEVRKHSVWSGDYRGGHLSRRPRRSALAPISAMTTTRAFSALSVSTALETFEHYAHVRLHDARTMLAPGPSDRPVA